MSCFKYLLFHAHLATKLLYPWIWFHPAWPPNKYLPNEHTLEIGQMNTKTSRVPLRYISTGGNLSPWPWYHGSGKWLYLKGNYCWRYTHLSLNKMIMGGKGYQSVYSISHFFTKHQKKNALENPPKKQIFAVSRCPGGIGIPFLFAIFFQKKYRRPRHVRPQRPDEWLQPTTRLAVLHVPRSNHHHRTENPKKPQSGPGLIHGLLGWDSFLQTAINRTSEKTKNICPTNNLEGDVKIWIPWMSINWLQLSQTLKESIGSDESRKCGPGIFKAANAPSDT